MAGTKRERQRTRARAARSAEETARRRRQGGLLAGAVAAVLVVVAGGVLVLNAVGGDDSTDTATPDGLPTDWPSDLPSELASFYTQHGPVSCEAPSGTEPQQQTFGADDWKDAKFRFAGTYAAILTTNCGEIKVELDTDAAKETSRALLYLTDRASYFDHTTCHRLTTDGVHLLECGDTAGDGSSAPAFTVPVENRPKAGADGLALYPRGTVAMAAGESGTPVGQFFIVHQDSRMAPDFTIVGEVTEGMDVVDHVVEGGVQDDATDGRPQQPLEITRMAGSVDLPVDSSGVPATPTG